MRTLIELSLRHPIVVAFMAVVALAWGTISLLDAPLDVFPEFVPPQVVVQTEAPGFSPEQVEQLITQPLESGMLGVIGLDTLRSESIAGLSVVTLTFDEHVDLERVRQSVAERVAESSGHLPAGVAAPKLSPLTSSTMDLLKVGLLSERLDPLALRDFADRTLRPRLLAIPGVARVTVYGGDVRQLQVRIDPARLEAADLSFTDVADAARAALAVRGGGAVDLAAQHMSVVVPATVATAEDLSHAVVAVRSGVPLALGDVADVGDGAAEKIGDALIQGKPGVLLAMSGQYGANTLTATHAIEAALEEIRPTLTREGITLVDRLHRPASFIERALRNLAASLAIGSCLILVVLLIFLRDWRSALISFITIPIALLVATGVLVWRGESLNTLTLGGLAVALGVLVDDAIIDIENIQRRLRLNAALANPKSTLGVILHASLEVRASVFYATLVVLLSFLPVFALGGVEGRLLAPMAQAFALSVIVSLVVALTLTPALSLLLLHVRPVAEPAWFSALQSGQLRAMAFVSRRRRAVSAVLLVLLAATAFWVPSLGGDLFPSFREGHFVLQVQSRLPGTSLAEMQRTGAQISKRLLQLPFVASVEQQTGRAEQGEDTWGTHRSEFHVELRAEAGIDQDEAQDRLHALLAEFPGIQFEVLTFLGDRLSETLSGETAQVIVNVVGPDLARLEQAAQRIAAIAARIPGAIDVRAKVATGAPEVDIQLDPKALGTYGVRTADALDAVEAAFGGTVVGQVFDGDRAIDAVVMLPRELRNRPESVGELPLVARDGTRVPLSAVAGIRTREGRFSIQHEAGRRRVAVTFNLSGRSAREGEADLVKALSSFQLPPGTHLEYAGEAQREAAARRSLLGHTFVAVILMVLALTLAFRERRHAWLVLLNLPFALIGAVAAVGVTGVGLTLGALVGLVTVFGISARNAILLLAHFEHLAHEEGEVVGPRLVTRGASERLRPVLMTALVTGLALVPLALGAGRPGHEIEAPMAIAVLGGLLTSTLLTLVVLPAFQLPRGARLIAP